MGFIRAITNVIPAMFNLGNIWGGIFKNMDYAFVEDATPDEIVLMLKEEGFGIPDDAWSVTVDGSPSPISSITWVGGVVTITLEEEIEYGDKVIVRLKGGGKVEAENEVLYYMLLESTGDGSGVATIRLQVSEDITATMVGGDARFYTNSAGTDGESDTWEIAAGTVNTLRTIYIRNAGASTKMKFTDGGKIRIINIPQPTLNSVGVETRLTNIPLLDLSVSTASLKVKGNLNEAVLKVEIRSIKEFSITNKFPNVNNQFWLESPNIIWKHKGNVSNKIGSTGGDWFRLYGGRLEWESSHPLLVQNPYIFINNSYLNLTFLAIYDKSNITSLQLLKYRQTKMTSEEMLIFLTNLTNRTGSLPSTITINDYADYNNVPQYITDAVNLLKTTKSVTTVNLGQ